MKGKLCGVNKNMHRLMHSYPPHLQMSQKASLCYCLYYKGDDLCCCLSSNGNIGNDDDDATDVFDTY